MPEGRWRLLHLEDWPSDGGWVYVHDDGRQRSLAEACDSMQSSEEYEAQIAKRIRGALENDVAYVHIEGCDLRDSDCGACRAQDSLHEFAYPVYEGRRK